MKDSLSMKKNIKNLFLTLLVLASSITALPVLQPQTAYAAPSNLNEQVKSYLYANAIAACFGNIGLRNSTNSVVSLFNAVSESNAAQGRWFRNVVNVTGNGASTTPGHYISANRPTVVCHDQNFIMEAMNFWGTDPIEVLCAMGFQRDNGSNCLSGTGKLRSVGGGEDARAPAFQSAIRQLYYGGTAPNGLSRAAEYDLYLRTFINGCEAISAGPYNEASTSERALGYRVKTLDDEIKIEDTLYTSILDKDDSVSVLADNNGNRVSFSCENLVAAINERIDAYRQYMNENRDEFESTKTAIQEAEDGTGTSCAIEGIGWIVCPASNFLASVTDGVFNQVTKLLEVGVFADTATNQSLHRGWSIMRNFANIAFVIAFLIIIFSQITSLGVDNYNIKKMLPRLIASAILVNISFYVTAIAVDIFNILGYSLQNIFIDLRDTATQNVNGAVPTWSVVVTNVLAGGTTAATVGGAAAVVAAGAAGTAFWAILGMLWPLLVIGFFSIIIALLVLAARQALIVILIIISPLAFVAFLLPNTESWFDRWRKTLTTLLIMFPIISLLFGGSQYAAALVMSTSDSAIIIILAMGMQVVPLALTPLVIKLSGNLLGRFAGMINNPHKGPFDRLRKSGAERIEQRKSRSNLSALQNAQSNSRRQRLARFNPVARAEKRKARIEADQRRLARSSASYVADETASNADYAAKLAGYGSAEQAMDADSSALTRVQAQARSVQSKLLQEDISAVVSQVKDDMVSDQDQGITNAANKLRDALRNNDHITARAISGVLANKGGPGIESLNRAIREAQVPDANGLVATDNSDSVIGLRETLESNVSAIKAKDASLADFINNGGNLETIQNNIGSSHPASTLSEAELATQTTKALENAQAMGAISQAQASSIVNNSRLYQDVKPKNKKIFEQIAGHSPNEQSAVPQSPPPSVADSSNYYIPNDDNTTHTEM